MSRLDEAGYARCKDLAYFVTSYTVSNWHARRRVSRRGRATIIWETPSPLLYFIMGEGERRRANRGGDRGVGSRGGGKKWRKNGTTEGIDADIQFSSEAILEATRRANEVEKKRTSNRGWPSERVHPSGTYLGRCSPRLFYATRPVTIDVRWRRIV